MALDQSAKARIERIFAEPDILESICMYVSNGGSVIGLARSFDIPASTIFNWIRKDEARAKAYEAAKSDRNEWIVEAVLDDLKQIAIAAASDAESSDLKYSNKIKAAELIAKHQKLFVERVDHTGNIKLEDLVSAGYNKAKEQTETGSTD